MARGRQGWARWFAIGVTSLVGGVMLTRSVRRRLAFKRADEALDNRLEDSFPASDPAPPTPGV